jgi:hypothetical protein
MRHEIKFGEMASRSLKRGQGLDPSRPFAINSERTELESSFFLTDGEHAPSGHDGPPLTNDHPLITHRPPFTTHQSLIANHHPAVGKVDCLSRPDGLCREGSPITAFLIDTLPIRIASKSFNCIAGARSNRHSPEAFEALFACRISFASNNASGANESFAASNSSACYAPFSSADTRGDN